MPDTTRKYLTTAEAAQSAYAPHGIRQFAAGAMSDSSVRIVEMRHPHISPSPLPPPRVPQPSLWGNVWEFVKLAGGCYLVFKVLKGLERDNRSERVVHGFDSEDAIAGYLATTGADVSVSAGSRGAADVIAEWDDGEIWAIQAKASKHGLPRRPGPAARNRLAKFARRRGARAVTALRTGTRTRYEDAVTGERLYPSGRTRAAVAGAGSSPATQQPS